MSWFRRRPTLKEPPKHMPHHRNSPMSERFLEETKERINPKLTDNLLKNKPGDKDERS